MQQAGDELLATAFSAAPSVTGDGSQEASATRAALLRQFSLQRMTGYGMELGDALTLRRLVESGYDWTPTALWLADRTRALAEWGGMQQQPAIETAALRRASACLRIAQVVTESDSAERRNIYGRAEDAFALAVAADGRYQRLVIPHPLGDMIAWLYSPSGAVSEPMVVVIGGVEGWALDLEGYALSLGDHGLATLLLDGPGQGQTRFQSSHFLSVHSMSAVCDAISYVASLTKRPVGIWGNSLGGNFAVHVASRSEHVAACCNNGGPRDPAGLGSRPRFFLKMQAMCGDVDAQRARQVFAGLALKAEAPKITCPLLVVHGGMDPLLTYEESAWICEASAGTHELALIPDGDHSIYNRPADKFAVVGGWFASALSQ